MNITLEVGRYVKIHSLASEKAKQHNGKTAIVKVPLNTESGRYGIETVGGRLGSKKILSIKPTNLTILCSCCKMREEQTSPEHIVCERCKKESYCSIGCKKKHWEGANKSSGGIPNSHEAWCIPLQLAMEVPTQPIGLSHPGDEAYENVTKYLHTAMEIGNSGRRNEERVMMEELIKVDSMQPSAYNNLFAACSELAVMAERYQPEAYKELEFKAIVYLTQLSDLLLSDEMVGEDKALDGPDEEMAEAFLRLIHLRALPFIEGCMRGQRGAEHPLLNRIEQCLMGIGLFFHQQDEPTYEVQLMLGYCLQKLTKYEEAIHEFAMVSKGGMNKGKKKNDDFETNKEWLHQSLLQIGLALYSDEKLPTERMELMDKAVTAFNEAITQFKKDCNKKNAMPAYVCQAQLGRCLYNKNSLHNQFVLREVMEYPDQEKEDLHTLLCDTVNEAMAGASAAADIDQVEEIRSLQNLPFK